MAEPSAELVQRAQAGDGEALVELVQGQQTYVYSIALGIMRNPTDAADMTQDAFMRLLRSLPTYRAEGGAKFGTWLYRLVTNICLDGLRRRGRPVDSLDAATSDDDETSLSARLADEDRWSDPLDQAQLTELSYEVRAALDELPTVQRLTLTLHYFQDMRYEDIAAITELPLNTVKSHIRRGKERLASILRPTQMETERMSCSATT